MHNSSLYDITEALATLDFVDEETGEINEDALNALELAWDEKAENIACYIKNLEADAAKLRDEEKALAERRRAKERKVERLRDYLASMMTLVGKTKVEYTRAVITTRKSQSVEVGEGFIKWAQENADDLLTYKEPTPNKTAIKEAIKAGAHVEHAQIVENITAQIK